MSDSTPTEPLGAPTAPLPVTPPPAPSGRRTVIILASVGGALLVALLVLVGVLIGRGSAPEAAPTESSTPSATPTETSPTPTPTPSQSEDDDDDDDDDKGPGNGGPGKKDTETSNGAIESFEVSTAKVDCKNATSVPLHFEWEAEGVSLWFGVGTDNAKAAPYGSYALDDEIDIDYQCGQSGKKQIYTVTVELANGDINSATLTIKE